MFSYGFLSVILALYLSGLGFSVVQIGVLFTVALAGGAVVTTSVAMFADRWERRTTLIASAIFMALGGIALATGNFLLLLIFAALATLSPSAQPGGIVALWGKMACLCPRPLFPIKDNSLPTT